MADSSVACRLKKNARNINSENFSGSLYRKADETNAASVFFRRPLNPSGRVYAARRARGGVVGKIENRCVRTAHTLRLFLDVGWIGLPNPIFFDNWRFVLGFKPDLVYRNTRIIATNRPAATRTRPRQTTVA